jgi:hypothetical protein
MGIDTIAAKMVLLLKNTSGQNMENTLVLGRQRNHIGSQFKKRISVELGISSKALSTKYADEFLFAVGAKGFQVLDISNYESAQVIQDLNIPIPDSLRNRYSVVMDIGTSEHVYDVAQSLANIRNLCSLGGQIMVLSPANRFLGHGFYQFSPELFFRAFGQEFGFDINALYLIKDAPFRQRWYQLSDPKNLGRRGNISTGKRCFIGVIATKVSEPQDIHSPFQSDYVGAWGASQVSRLGAKYLTLPPLLQRLLDITAIAILRRFRNRISPQKFHWKDGAYIPLVAKRRLSPKI